MGGRKGCIAPSADASTSFAIATVTRKPHRFQQWLEYYRQLGAARMFIAVEDSPAVVEQCLQHLEFVSMSHSTAERNPYHSIIDRQEAHVNWALKQCESTGIGWLFHVDDDELLHFHMPWDVILAQVPEDTDCIVISNVEAVPEHAASDFTTISRFMTEEEHMLAYVNGKAGGRVGAVDACGCHRFTGEEWLMPQDCGVVLHFESCPYSRWRSKFLHYATLQTRLASIPFPFYVDSIKFCKAHSGDEAKLRTFWRRRKQWHYGVRKQGVRTIYHLGLDVEKSDRVTTRGAATILARPDGLK